MTKINPPDDRLVAIASWPIVQLCIHGWCHSNLNKLQLEEYARVFDDYHSATDSAKHHKVIMTRGALQGVLTHLLACRLDAASNVVVWQRALADALLDDDNRYIAEISARAGNLADKEGMGRCNTIDACAEVEKVLKHQDLVARLTEDVPNNPRFDVTSHVERWCPHTNGCGGYEPPVGLTVEESQLQGITLEAYGRLEDEGNQTHRRVRTVLGASEARELASALLAAAEKLEKYADVHPRQIGGTVLLGGAS